MTSNICDSTHAHVRKPPWLRVGLPGYGDFADVRRQLRHHGLVTVCTEASCPNLGECWAHRTLTIMILGDTCTRNCRFCDVQHHPCPAPPDADEPRRVASILSKLGVRYAVITSVTRDDLPDGGAAHWAEVIRYTSEVCQGVEALVPDFGGDFTAIDTVLQAHPTVFAHNIETVRRLSPHIRPLADYDRSLAVLSYASQQKTVVKSSLLLGMGETQDEVFETLRNLRNAGVMHLAIGQYLAPSRHHAPVERFLLPEEFDMLRIAALEMGFSAVLAGPLVRSSYHAHEMADGNIAR